MGRPSGKVKGKAKGKAKSSAKPKETHKDKKVTHKDKKGIIKDKKEIIKGQDMPRSSPSNPTRRHSTRHRKPRMAEARAGMTSLRMAWASLATWQCWTG